MVAKTLQELTADDTRKRIDRFRELGFVYEQAKELALIEKDGMLVSPLYMQKKLLDRGCRHALALEIVR